MFGQHTGEIAAIGAAIFWAFTALSFESACKKIGSLSVNLIRLCMAFVLITIYNYITRGMLLPFDASSFSWTWLLVSGFIGFALGDLFLFEAFTVIGSRISMLIMALVPPITAIIGWFLMHEVMAWSDILGMSLTVGGVMWVVSEREGGKKWGQLKHPVKGVLLGLGGAFGQAIGLVLSKKGMGNYDAFAATQIRIIAGIAGFSLYFTGFGIWPRVGKALKNKNAMFYTSLGAVFGPFLGVSFSLLAVQAINTGIASTFMAIVPVLIIPPAVIFFNEKLTVREVIGAVIAVTGIAILFIK